MPTPASNISSAAIGTDIYVPGGGAGVAGNTLQVYSTTTDTWTTVATDPLPASLLGTVCAAFNGKLYVFGGYTTTYVSTTYIYDPAAPAGARWTAGAPCPLAAYFGAAVPVGNLIFWAGMRNATTDLNSVYAYDPAANTWTQYPNLTTARGGAGAWADGTMLYVGAGGWGTYLTSVEIYDTAQGPAGTWAAGPPLIGGRRAFAPATDFASGIFYAGGGWNGGYMTSAEVLEKCVLSCILTLAPATLPNGDVGTAYSQPITATGGTAPYTYGVLSGTLPAGLTLDPNTGILSGTPTAGGSSTFTLYATDSAGACAGTLEYTLVICAPITVAPATLPGGNLGLPYSAAVSATGGVGPYTYAVTAGALPAGVTLDPLTGILSGTPTAGGDFSVTITATDANGCTGSTAYTVTFATYDVNLQDEYGRAFVCINTASGAWSWTILRGPGVGLTFTGVGILTSFNGTVNIASPAGQPINVSIKYLARYHRGSASFFNRPQRINSSIYDNNTLNNTVVCP